jgi:hypothetical protein
MFKAAKEGPAKVITGNNLGDGRVVFLDQEGGWTHFIAEARVMQDGPDLESGLAFAKAEYDARVVVESYPDDLTVVVGVPVSVGCREKIRADRGPTFVYGADEVAKLRAAG